MSRDASAAITCPDCEGSGWRIDDDAPADFLPEWCWRCDMTGSVEAPDSATAGQS